MNPIDQRVRDAGFNYVPFNQYLASPFIIPQSDVEEGGSSTAGLPSINIGGGGGGNPFTGGITDLTRDYFNTVSGRQDRLKELNRPMREIPGEIIPGVRGDPIVMEKLAPYGAPEDFYKGSIEGVPQTISGASGIFTRGEPTMEKPTLNRRIQDAFYSLPFLSKPQSADQIIEEGYTPSVNFGILANILPDRFGSLPRGDQAFIQRSMGYTGPTVFGANTSGLSKDPFGINTRSAFGNYAEKVETVANDLTGSLGGRLTDKYQDMYNTDDEGLSFNPTTGLYEGTNKAAVAKANAMTNMMRAKRGYMLEQIDIRDADRAAAAAAQAAAEAKAAAEGKSDPADRSRTGSSGRRPGSGGAVIASDDQSDRGKGQTGGYSYDSGGREGFGYGLAEGGIVDMLEIYD